MALPNSNHFVVHDGKIQRSSTEDHIKWCVRSVLSMQKGELLTDMNLGADLMQLMFRRDSPKLREEIKSRIHFALKNYEPRVELEETEIVPDESEPSLLSVKVKYRIKETKRLEMVRVLL